MPSYLLQIHQCPVVQFTCLLNINALFLFISGFVVEILVQLLMTGNW